MRQLPPCRARARSSRPSDSATAGSSPRRAACSSSVNSMSAWCAWAPVAGRQFEDVELFGKAPAVGQLVQMPEQIEDQVARRGEFRASLSPPGSTAFSTLSHGLLPGRQGLRAWRGSNCTTRNSPSRPPDSSRTDLRRRRGRRCRPPSRASRPASASVTSAATSAPRQAAAAQVDGQLVAVDDILPPAPGAAAIWVAWGSSGRTIGRVPEVVPVLDPSRQDHPRPGQGPRRTRTAPRPAGRTPPARPPDTAKLAVGAYVNFHRAGI